MNTTNSYPTSTSDSYYNLLGIDPDSVSEAIQAAYYRAAACFHPDKLPLNFPNATGAEILQYHEHYLKIQKAWETLSDPAQRQEYDKNLANNAQRGNEVHYTTNLDDMTDFTIDDDGNIFAQCSRCTVPYMISAELFVGDEIIIECESCNLRYCLKLEE